MGGWVDGGGGVVGVGGGVGGGGSLLRLQLHTLHFPLFLAA